MPGIIALNSLVYRAAANLAAAHRTPGWSARRQAVAGDMFDPKRTGRPLDVIAVAVGFPGGLELRSIHVAVITRASKNLELVRRVRIQRPVLCRGRAGFGSGAAQRPPN